MNEEEFSRWSADYKGHLSEYQIYLHGKADALASWFPPRRVWMPIDSAPKDGSAFLAWDGHYMYAVEWKDGFSLVMPGFRCEDADADGLTHWMPLPEKPE